MIFFHSCEFTDENEKGILNQDLIFRLFADPRVRLLVLLTILAALAYQVSLLVWHYYPAETASIEESTEMLDRPNSAQSAVNYQQQASSIGQAFLFGKPTVDKVEVIVEKAPETKLKYKLRGIYYSKQSDLSSAIVEVRPNKSKFYLLGEDLADKISLAKIEADHILIDRYGKLERLNLQKPVPITNVENRSRPSSRGTIRASAILRSYKKRYSSNPMAIARRFQAVPVQQNGKNLGFKLKALRGESLLRKLDFKPDDVFTAVNGASLSDPFVALDAIKSLATSDDITVTFTRNGVEQTASFQL